MSSVGDNGGISFLCRVIKVQGFVRYNKDLQLLCLRLKTWTPNVGP